MPDVKMHGITRLKVTSAQVLGGEGMLKEVTTVSFQADAPPGEIARLIHFRGQRRNIDVAFESPHAETDLQLQLFNVKTGEIPVER